MGFFFLGGVQWILRVFFSHSKDGMTISIITVDTSIYDAVAPGLTVIHLLVAFGSKGAYSALRS
jgi:hypothetical protein